MSEQRTLSNDPRAAYHSRRGLFAFLAMMRALYARDLSDVEISRVIRHLPRGMR